MPAGSKPCRVCAEHIKVDARKCIHCGAWQNWYGTFGREFNTGLALLIALLSVVVAAIPMLSNALLPKNSILTTTYQAYGQYFDVVVSNSGGRPGTITQLELGVASNGPLRGYIEMIPAGSATEAILVPPGGSVLVQWNPYVVIITYRDRHQHIIGLPELEKTWNASDYKDLDILENEAEHGHAKCHFIVNMTNFDGSARATYAPVNCIAAASVLSAAELLIQQEFEREYPGQPLPTQKK